jgi:hypothetical protein
MDKIKHSRRGKMSEFIKLAVTCFFTIIIGTYAAFVIAAYTGINVVYIFGLFLVIGLVYINFKDQKEKRKENEHLKSSGFPLKLNVIIFSASALFTLASFLEIHRLGINTIFLFFGLAISLLVVMFFGKSQRKIYDSLEKHPIIDYSNRKKIFDILIVLLLMSLLFFNLQDIKEAVFSLFGGFVIWMWFSFFQLIHWEKKNHKTIYIDKSYGTWKKSVIVLEKK